MHSSDSGKQEANSKNTLPIVFRIEQIVRNTVEKANRYMRDPKRVRATM